MASSVGELGLIESFEQLILASIFRPFALKRLFDLVLSVSGLVFLAPLLGMVAVVIKLGDGGTILFSQVRVGYQGKRFRILKFRTMKMEPDQTGPQFTVKGDSRITPAGRFLRRAKIDELPQLWNVVRGEMTFVGPRPEVPAYVELFSEEQKKVLEYVPGITGLATLEFRNEERWLAEADNPEEVYINEVIPRKIELNLKYAETATWWQDFKLIMLTIVALFNVRSVPTRGAGHSDEPRA